MRDPQPCHHPVRAMACTLNLGHDGAHEYRAPQPVPPELSPADAAFTRIRAVAMLQARDRLDQTLCPHGEAAGWACRKCVLDEIDRAVCAGLHQSAPTPEAVERVARAIYVAVVGAMDEEHFNWVKPVWEKCARAALAALREEA